MKIKSLAQKTVLEIADNDVLVIEDEQDTKQITVADLREYFLSSGVDTNTKKLINQTLENISASLLAAKYVVSELLTYEVSAWIENLEYITIALRKDGSWLTTTEIFNLFADADMSAIKVLVADTYVTADSNVIEDGILKSDTTMTVGTVKLHFAGLTQNEVAGITYDDIEIELEETEEFRYEFTGVPELFSNDISYVEDIE